MGDEERVRRREGGGRERGGRERGRERERKGWVGGGNNTRETQSKEIIKKF